MSWMEMMQRRESKENMEDEDEVLYELDDFAMAQLPRHLQENMREIQMERFSRLSAQNANLEILANPHRMHANRRHTTNEDSMHPPCVDHQNFHIGTETGERLLNSVMRSASLRTRPPRPRRERPVTIMEDTWMRVEESYQYDDYIMADIGPSLAPHEYRAPVAPSSGRRARRSVSDGFLQPSHFHARGRTAGGHRRGHGNTFSPGLGKKASRLMSRLRVPVKKSFCALRRFLKKET